MASRTECLAALERALPPGRVTSDRDTLSSHGTDWTRLRTPAPTAVVLPRSTEEVVTCLRICRDHETPVVPSGGRTGLAGGAVAAHGEVVLSLDRMRTLFDVDPVARTVRAEAGVVTQEVHAHCAPYGLTWPVDFASSGSSQVGGNIATNAGGVRVVRYGLTRQWVLGLQVVTMSGEVLELNGALEKNNTGPDLRQLFIGTEGTLGVITAATLKLAPLPGESRVALLAVANLRQALEVFASSRETRELSLLAFEYMTHRCLDLVLDVKGAPRPLENRAPAYVLVELEQTSEDGREDRWLEKLFEDGLVVDGVLADSPRQSRDLWSLREGISESLTHRGFVHKNDVSIPVSRLADFGDSMFETFSNHYPDFDVFVFGHIGDGNLHVNIMKPPDMDRAAFVETCHDTDRMLFETIERFGGSISAEHGIGLLKKPFLHYSRTPEELRIFRELKRALDPKGLLNPGKIFD